MRIFVEVVRDRETKQWSVAMVASPWIASCGRTRSEAKRKFAEAFRAYFKTPARRGRSAQKGKPAIELVTVA